MQKVEGKYVYRAACGIFTLLIATGMFMFVWVNFITENNQTGHLTGLGNLGMATLLYAGLFYFIGKWIGAFEIGVTRMAANMASVALTAFTVDVLEIFLSMAITGKVGFFWNFLGKYVCLFCLQFIVLCALTYPMVVWYRKLFPALRLLEVYGDKRHGLHAKIDGIKYKYHVEDTVHYRDGIEEIKKKIKKVDAVLISDIPSHEKNMVLKTCVDMDKRVYFIPKISDVIVRYSEELNLIDTPLFLRRRIGLNTWERAVKRFFDVILSGAAIVVASPVLLVTAIAIKYEDGGPVFFRQERVTIGGKRFMILKFRSMIVDAEKDRKPHPAGEKDPRITKVGNIIRATRIDELPQLWNIVKGDMSIVGPRPERYEHVEKYTQMIPEFSFREKVKGGLTGYAQVYGKYNTTALDKLKMDLMYIMDYSLLLDLKIIFETVKILLRKESTEGFSAERAEEMHNG